MGQYDYQEVHTRAESQKDPCERVLLSVAELGVSFMLLCGSAILNNQRFDCRRSLEF